jgi:hypothetical protein
MMTNIFKRLVLTVTILISTFAIVSVLYWIYLFIPYTSEEFKSPYHNATIKIVLDGKLPFFSFNAGPVNGKYLILYRDNVVDELVRSEVGFTNDIEDIKWYRDSVKFKYIDNLDGHKTVHEKVYKFPKTIDQ